MKKNNVKRLRRSYNLSQTEMAKELDIPQTRISEWELGKTQLSDEDAEMLAEYFEVTAAFVKGDTMNKQESYDVVQTDNIITSFCPQTAPGVAFSLLSILVGEQGRHIFYSFLCKCDLFTNRFNVPKLTGIFVEELE